MTPQTTDFEKPDLKKAETFPAMAGDNKENEKNSKNIRQEEEKAVEGEGAGEAWEEGDEGDIIDEVEEGEVDKPKDVKNKEKGKGRVPEIEVEKKRKSPPPGSKASHAHAHALRHHPSRTRLGQTRKAVKGEAVSPPSPSAKSPPSSSASSSPASGASPLLLRSQYKLDLQKQQIKEEEENGNERNIREQMFRVQHEYEFLRKHCNPMLASRLRLQTLYQPVAATVETKPEGGEH